jgi:putative flippase GtrA
MPTIFAKIKSELPAVVRYVLVMGLGWLTDMAVFSFAILYINVPLAQLFARVTGALVGFIMHKHFTFQRENTPAPRAAIRYIMLWFVSYFVSTGFILLLINFKFQTLGAKVLVETVIVPINFFLMQRFVFARQA